MTWCWIKVATHPMIAAGVGSTSVCVKWPFPALYRVRSAYTGNKISILWMEIQTDIQTSMPLIIYWYCHYAKTYTTSHWCDVRVIRGFVGYLWLSELLQTFNRNSRNENTHPFFFSSDEIIWDWIRRVHVKLSWCGTSVFGWPPLANAKSSNLCWATSNIFTQSTYWSPCWKGPLCYCLRMVPFGI